MQEALLPKISKREPIVIHGNRKGFFDRKKKSELHLLFIIFIDVLLLNAILLGSMLLQLEPRLLFGQYQEELLLFLFIANSIGILVAAFSNIYGLLEGVKLSLKIKNLFWGSLIFFGSISLIYDQFFYDIFGIHFLIPAMICFTGLSFLAHMFMRYYNRDKTSFLSYAVVGGRPSNLRYLERVLASTYGENTFCLGQFSDKDIPGVARLGGFSDVLHKIKNNLQVNKLLYYDSPLSTKEVQYLEHLCRTHFIDFEVVPKGIAYFEKGTQVEQIAHLPILRRRREPLHLLQNRIFKRAFDIVFSLLVILFVFSWLYPLIAVLIKLSSKGPVLFSQKRTGYWNKPFLCLKFRTMKVNNNSHKKQAVKNDPRITKIGAILRKTNLDEFPQFINVLKGDMSVVGPRPHMLKHTKDYSALLDKYMIRHEVKPGITGWAQVNGWRGPTDQLYKMVKRVEYDVNYIENWSFWFDCKCIFLTVFNMVKGEENAF